MNPDRMAELQEERDFLLRSISDLDAEHDAGDVDEADYAVLRDGYTARAAVVLRAIDAGTAARATFVRRKKSVTAAWVAGVIAVASLAGWLVADNSGQRVAGQTITGGQPIDAVTSKLAQARAAFRADPTTAFVLYREVLDAEPADPEARTYLGWLLAQSSQGVETEAASAGLETAVQLLTDVTVDTPDYTDAHCFLAVVAGRYLTPPNVELALAEGRVCMSNDPTGMTSQLVGPLMDELAAAPAVTSAG